MFKYLIVLVGLLFTAVGTMAYAQTVSPLYREDGLVYESYQLNDISMRVSSREEFIRQIRLGVVRVLIDQGFVGWNPYPYGRTSSATYALTADRTDSSYQVTRPQTQDVLDHLISQKTNSISERPRGSSELREYSSLAEIVFTPIEIKRLKNIYLRKITLDLEALGYRLVSHRSRITHDKPYRLYNVSTALMMMGHVRVVMPGETVKFMSNIGYDPGVGKRYKAGYGILGNKEALIYAGGICGASTAVYQGILANQGFTILKSRNHSKRYNAYYNATINGIDVTVPGLDAMVFGGQQDLVFRNDRHYPLIIVSNMDATFGSAEEVFSLGMEQDRGSIEFIGTFSVKKQSCATWKVNGRIVERCYGKVIK